MGIRFLTLFLLFTLLGSHKTNYINISKKRCRKCPTHLHRPSRAMA